VRIVSFCELGVDNSQSKIQQEESSSEDDDGEVDDDNFRGHLLYLDLSVTPTFKGCSLEHNEKRVEYIIEVSSSVVWICVTFTAVIASTAVSVG
jgi:hypothetical protein